MHFVRGSFAALDLKLMKKVRKLFLLSLLGVLPIAFIFQRQLERTGHSDSLGLWYTIYGALLLSLVVATVVAVVAVAVRFLRKGNP
jgi:hypothetical protein